MAGRSRTGDRVRCGSVRWMGAWTGKVPTLKVSSRFGGARTGRRSGPRKGRQVTSTSSALMLRPESGLRSLTLNGPATGGPRRSSASGWPTTPARTPTPSTSTTRSSSRSGRNGEGGRPGPPRYGAMRVGLVGFAGSGKTTVFNTMTGLAVPTGYGGELRLGTVKVPDERIDALSKIFSPKKTTYAEVVFCDVPGEHGADHKGLSRKALQQIRDQEVLCLVLRAFPNPAIEGAADPASDLESFHTECVLADLDIVEKRIDRAKKEKPDPLELAAFELMKETLERELPLRALPPAALNRDYLKVYGLLTDRPLLVAVNRIESEAAQSLADP